MILFSCKLYFCASLTPKSRTLSQESKEVYAVPAKFRSMENMHILFWLIKDICWCLSFRPLGIAMIFPTLFIAVWIMWKNRSIASELFHNISIVLWITANSMWMVAEFMEVDEQVKPYCLIPFSLGILLLLFYYLIYSPAKRRKIESPSVVVVPVESTAQVETI